MNGAAAVRPMTVDEYAEWRAAQTASYAAEMVASGALDAEAARLRAEQQTAELLADGLQTPGMHLLRVLDEDGAAVGVLWLGPHPHRADAGFVYDVEIDEAHRGRGRGRAAMLAAEEVAAEEGWSDLGLNVFGPNARARALYASLGYAVVSTTMAKRLS